MAQFSVKTGQIRPLSGDEARMAQELAGYADSIGRIANSLSFNSWKTANIRARLRSASQNTSSHRAGMSGLSSALTAAMDRYDNAERRTVDKLGGQLGQSGIVGAILKHINEVLIGMVGAAVGVLGSSIFANWWDKWYRDIWKKRPGPWGWPTPKPPKPKWPTITIAGGWEGVVRENEKREAIADLKKREGTVIADINGENYCSSKNISYNGGYQGQCTWYAYGRFMEVTGIKLNTALHAKTWLYDNAGDSRVKVTRGGEDILWPAIAVQEHGGYGYGHVMFVEGVEYNEDGTPAYVYITEANNNFVKPDGKLQRLTYQEYKDKGISGYITKA